MPQFELIIEPNKTVKNFWKELWQYRERISESITPRTPYKNDVSVRISQVPQFLHEINESVASLYPNFEVVWFGHIGDGNLHLNILKPEEMAIDFHRWKDDRERRRGEQYLAIKVELTVLRNQ